MVKILKEHIIIGGNKMKSKCFDYTMLTLVIIFKFDLVAFLFGQMTWLSRVIYAIIGLCGLYLISLFGRISAFGEE